MSNMRLGGVPMAKHKHVWIALTDIFGIGRTTACKICDSIGLDRTTKIADMTDSQFETIQAELNKYTIEGNLRTELRQRMKHLRDINCYRGRRHKARLPANGQRTKTNARTAKGGRKSHSSGSGADKKK